MAINSIDLFLQILLPGHTVLPLYFHSCAFAHVKVQLSTRTLCLVGLSVVLVSILIWYDAVWCFVSSFIIIIIIIIIINLLKPTGHVMHQQFNIQQLYVLPTLHLCVLYLSENKQRLVSLTA